MSERMTQAESQPSPADGQRPPDDPVEDRGRPDVPPMLRKLAAWSWRLLVILTAAGLALYLLIQLKVIVVPVIVALFLATLLVPLVSWLEARGWSHLPAVLTVFGGAVLLLVAIILGFIPLIGNELDTLRQRADEGVAEVQRYIASRPVRAQRGRPQPLPRPGPRALHRELQRPHPRRRRGRDPDRGGDHRADPLPVPDLLLRQGLRALHPLDPRLRRSAPRRPPARDRHPLGHRGLGYLRGQAAVGAVDAIFIGIGLAILGVPLVVPLAFLTFVAAFLPLVGAVVAGALAALVALVTKGVTTALIVVGITLLVQQLEGHLLAPLLLGRAVSLHPVVIILALAAGAILGGIIGAFLAVPIAAVVTAVGTYLRGEPVGVPADAGEPEPETSERAGAEREPG